MNCNDKQASTLLYVQPAVGIRSMFTFGKFLSVNLDNSAHLKLQNATKKIILCHTGYAFSLLYGLYAL